MNKDIIREIFKSYETEGVMMVISLLDDLHGFGVELMHDGNTCSFPINPDSSYESANTLIGINLALLTQAGVNV